MTDPTFKSNRRAELPTAFRDPQGFAWADGMGEVQDQEVSLLGTAAVSRFPYLCPDDALDLCGTWLLLPRLDGEVDGDLTSGYRGRLCVASAHVLAVAMSNRALMHDRLVHQGRKLNRCNHNHHRALRR